MTSPENINESRIAVLEAGFVEHAKHISRLDDKVDATAARLESKLDKVIESLAGRPSWAVASFIGILSSTCVGLAVALVTLTN